MPVLLTPENLTAGDAIQPGVYTVVGARFVEWDYNGRTPSKSPALAMTLRSDDGDEHLQYWSAGSLDQFRPSATGNDGEAAPEGPYLCRVGVYDKLSGSSNVGRLIQSLGRAGFPPASYSPHAGQMFDGLRAHFDWEERPQRAPQPGQETRGPQRTLVVRSIVSLPGEGIAATAAAPAVPAVSAEDIARRLLEKALAGGKPVLKARVVGQVFDEVDPSQQNAVVMLLNSKWAVEQGICGMDGASFVPGAA